MGDLKEALKMIDECLDQRHFEKASQLGYADARVGCKIKLNYSRHSRELIGLRPQRALYCAQGATCLKSVDLDTHQRFPGYGYIPSPSLHPDQLLRQNSLAPKNALLQNSSAFL